MIKVTNTANWERTKNTAMIITLTACTAIFSYRYAQDIETPPIDVPTIAFILTTIRICKNVMKEG